MKFKPGNLLKNEVNGGLWIVTEVIEIDKKIGRRNRFRMQLNAACMQPGLSRVNFAGSSDTWFFKEVDGNDGDHMWTVINEV